MFIMKKAKCCVNSEEAGITCNLRNSKRFCGGDTICIRSNDIYQPHCYRERKEGSVKLNMMIKSYSFELAVL